MAAECSRSVLCSSLDNFISNDFQLPVKRLHVEEKEVELDRESLDVVRDVIRHLLHECVVSSKAFDHCKRYRLREGNDKLMVDNSCDLGLSISSRLSTPFACLEDKLIASQADEALISLPESSGAGLSSSASTSFEDLVEAVCIEIDYEEQIEDETCNPHDTNHELDHHGHVHQDVEGELEQQEPRGKDIDVSIEDTTNNHLEPSEKLSLSKLTNTTARASSAQPSMKYVDQEKYQLWEGDDDKCLETVENPIPANTNFKLPTNYQPSGDKQSQEEERDKDDIEKHSVQSSVDFKSNIELNEQKENAKTSQGTDNCKRQFEDTVNRHENLTDDCSVSDREPCSNISNGKSVSPPRVSLNPSRPNVCGSGQLKRKQAPPEPLSRGSETRRSSYRCEACSQYALVNFECCRDLYSHIINVHNLQLVDYIEQYSDDESLSVLQCKLCGAEDVQQSSKAILQHLEAKHPSLTIEDFFKDRTDFPEEAGNDSGYVGKGSGIKRPRNDFSTHEERNDSPSDHKLQSVRNTPVPRENFDFHAEYSNSSLQTESRHSFSCQICKNFSSHALDAARAHMNNVHGAGKWNKISFSFHKFHVCLVCEQPVKVEEMEFMRHLREHMCSWQDYKQLNIINSQTRQLKAVVTTQETNSLPLIGSTVEQSPITPRLIAPKRSVHSETLDRGRTSNKQLSNDNVSASLLTTPEVARSREPTSAMSLPSESSAVMTWARSDLRTLRCVDPPVKILPSLLKGNIRRSNAIDNLCSFSCLVPGCDFQSSSFIIISQHSQVVHFNPRLAAQVTDLALHNCVLCLQDVICDESIILKHVVKHNVTMSVYRSKLEQNSKEKRNSECQTNTVKNKVREKGKKEICEETRSSKAPQRQEKSMLGSRNQTPKPRTARLQQDKQQVDRKSSLSSKIVENITSVVQSNNTEFIKLNSNSSNKTGSTKASSETTNANEVLVKKSSIAPLNPLDNESQSTSLSSSNSLNVNSKVTKCDPGQLSDANEDEDACSGLKCVFCNKSASSIRSMRRHLVKIHHVSATIGLVDNLLKKCRQKTKTNKISEFRKGIQAEKNFANSISNHSTANGSNKNIDNENLVLQNNITGTSVLIQREKAERKVACPEKFDESVNHDVKTKPSNFTWHACAVCGLSVHNNVDSIRCHLLETHNMEFGTYLRRMAKLRGSTDEGKKASDKTTEVRSLQGKQNVVEIKKDHDNDDDIVVIYETTGAE